MDRQKQSREEWEREFIDVQHNLSPAEDLRATQIIAKKLSATPARSPMPYISSEVFWAGRF